MSFSRVSTITGLHRHVVSDIVNSEAAAPSDGSDEKDYRRNRLARVLTGWYENPHYTDTEGKPLTLPVDGPKPSFASLVHSFSGDIYPKIILDELIEVGAVKMLKNGKLRAVTRRYTTGGAEPMAIEHLGSTIRDAITTLEHNLSAPADARLFEDSVVSVKLDRAALPLFRRLLTQRGAAFLEDVQGWVAEHERPDSERTIRAGVLVQMFVETESSPADEPATLRNE